MDKTKIIYLTASLAAGAAIIFLVYYSNRSPAPPSPASPLSQPPRDISISSQLIIEGLVSPVGFISAGDGTGRMFIVEQTGNIKIVDAQGVLLEEIFLNLKNKMVPLSENYDERGLLGLAFHPDYKNNGRFFVHYSAPLRSGAPQGWDNTGVISEFKVSQDNPNVADPASEKIILQIDQPQSNHNGGSIAFGPEGYLYIASGDGGQANDVGLGHPPSGNGQDTSTLLGKILRIDVNRGDPYSNPADNPFNGTDGADEIFAYGFRNPYQISFDTQGSKRLFAADAGQNLWEEADIVEKGKNYGWNIREGKHCFDPQNADKSPDQCASRGAAGEALIDPIIEYAHPGNGGPGIAIVGGYAYRGESINGLAGNYIFADWSKSFSAGDGSIFAAEESDDGWHFTGLSVAGEQNGRLGYFIKGMGRDDRGELYILTSETAGPNGNTGKIFKLVSDEKGAMKNSELMQTGRNLDVSEEANVGYFAGANGYFVRPESGTSYPGIVMIHENRGLRPEIRDAAKKLAQEGYMVLAVDLLGGIAEDQAGARILTEKFDQETGIANMKAAANFLRDRGAVKIASLGWCFGGRQSLELATSGETLNATVVYYGGGMPTTTDELSPIKWPVLGIFGDQDQSIPVDMVRTFESSLNSLGIPNEIYIYPGVGHAFANPSGMNYAPEATIDAWQKTLSFLEKNLK